MQTIPGRSTAALAVAAALLFAALPTAAQVPGRADASPTGPTVHLEAVATWLASLWLPWPSSAPNQPPESARGELGSAIDPDGQPAMDSQSETEWDVDEEGTAGPRTWSDPEP